MNFWGVNENDRPTRLYIEVGDPSDDTILTSMYMIDLRLAKRPVFVGAWWTHDGITTAAWREVKRATPRGSMPAPDDSPTYRNAMKDAGRGHLLRW